jgi:AhpC/TSA family
MLLLIRSRLVLLVLGGLGFLAPGCSPPQPPPEPGGDPPPPGFSLRDVAGVEHHPFTDPAVKAVALVFVLADCPIANGYAPEIHRLCAAYGPRGVRFFLVQVDEDLSSRAAAEHAREYGYTCPVVLDGRRVLVRRAGARMVPEAAVFGPDGERKYLGRIDDLYADLGKRRARATSLDLRDALDAVLADRPVPRPVTQAVGCFIPPLSSKDP